MTIETRTIDYVHDGVSLEGVLAHPASAGPHPAVLVSHAWAGRSDFEVDAAKRLAEHGYAGFALDLYGKGVLGSSAEENQSLMEPFVADRAMLQSRLGAALETVKGLPEADASKVVAIGYCFGGLCALDMARAGMDVAGVASFHGLLSAPGNTAGNKIAAKVIAFHGWDDPMATPEDAVAFGTEMTDAGADWRLHAYGGVMHAFTNPQANDPDFGTVFNQQAADRSWASLLAFLEECFG